MKMREFKTGKGEFVAVYLPIEELFTQDKVIKAFIESNNYIQNLLGNTVEYKLICKLSEVTEEQAKNVVDDPLFGNYKSYISCFKQKICSGDYVLKEAIHSIHSLLKSKGIDINNGNLYLFKKI